jgi:hypothetical protein
MGRYDRIVPRGEIEASVASTRQNERISNQ